MLRIAAETRLSPEEAIKQAIEFFGPSGYGLEIQDQAPACVNFQGMGGRIEVIACTAGKQTSVELVSHEFDHQVREFTSKLPR